MDLLNLSGARPEADLQRLQEERKHGYPDLPVGLYRMAPGPGEPVLDMHWHGEWEFLIMEQGKAIFQIGLTAYEVRAGEVLFIPGGELHGGYWPETEMGTESETGSEKETEPETDPGPATAISDTETGPPSACAYSAIVFDLDWLAGRGGQDRIASRWLSPLQRGELSLPQHLAREHPSAAPIHEAAMKLAALESTDSPGKPLRLAGGLLGLFAEYADAGLAVRQDPWNASRTETPERLIRVLAMMEQEIGRKWSIAQLARAAGMSEGHFSRLFKLYLRQTPIAYLNGLRLRRAAELLRQPGVSVSEAALSCGFDNFSYFSKMFRARYGRTPSDYRV